MKIYRLIFWIVVLFPFPHAALALNSDEAVELALDHHQQLAVARADSAAADARARGAQAPFWPRADLNYSYSSSSQVYGTSDEFSILQVSASLNLFNGFGDLYGLVAAESRRDAADFQLRATTADIVLATRTAFIEALRTRRAVETATEGVQLLERQRRDAELRFTQGMIARNDLLRIEVELSNARQDLLRAEGRDRIAVRTLERLTGTVLGDQLLEEPAADAVSEPDEFAFSPGYRDQLDRRSELRYLEKLTAAAAADHAAAAAGYMPKVDIGVSNEYYGDTANPVSGDSIYDDDTIISLTARWNIFAGKETVSRRAAAAAQRNALAARLRDARAELLLQLETALQDARIAVGRVMEATAGVEQAEENYRVTENLRKHQQATVVDLLDARFLLTRARNLKADARYDLLASRAVIDRVLERNLPRADD